MPENSYFCVEYMFMKNTNLFYSIVLVGLLAMVISCEKNDDEPVPPSNSISRLYVSLAEFQTDETKDPYQNLVILDPADGNDMRAISFDSQVNGGGSLIFNPFVSRIFQASTNNGGVQMLGVSDIGIPNRSGRLSNDTLTGIRSIQYDHVNRMLLVANTLTPSGIFVFDNPMNRNGEVPPLKHFPLNNDRPWAMHLWQDSLLVVRTGANAGICLYTNINRAIQNDEDDLVPASVINFAGASGVRGMAYSPELDLLVLADFEGSRILFFENLSDAFGEASSTLAPTRILTGSNTGLTSPIDVTVDARPNGQLLYVADRNSKTVLRFPLDVSGNVAPQYRIEFDLTPESVFIDARGEGGNNL